MDLLSSIITSIRNGQNASRRHVVCRISNKKLSKFSRQAGLKLVKASLDVIYNQGYIRGYSFINQEAFSNKKLTSQVLIIYLKYDSNGNSAIRSIFRASTLGRRIYTSTRSL